jgi:hypothetical protein
MARHKIKLAALATTLVAALGVAAAAPASGVNAGGTHTSYSSLIGGTRCC